MNRYVYDGPVMIFDQVAQEDWHAETMAVSAKKAKSNLQFRWKKENGYTADIKIHLPGKLEIEED